MSAARRRACVEHVTAELDVSERFACRVLGQHRSVQRRAPERPDDEAALRESIIGLARQYGRCGDLRITALLRAEAKVLIEGWRKHYNTVRPHSSLSYRPPAAEVRLTPIPPSPTGLEPSGSAPVPAILH